MSHPFTGLPQDRQQAIRANIERMRAQHATDDEVSEYLTRYEGLTPTSAAPADGESPEHVGHLAGLAESAAKGLSFGFSDEALGALEAGYDELTGDETTPSFAERYRARRDAHRQRAKQYAAEHPVLAVGGELAGALPLGVFGAARAGLARLALEGAAYGAASGAGNAEGDLSDRLKGAAEGGVAGGVLGAAAGKVVPTLGRAGSRVFSRAADALGKRPATIESAGRAARALGIESIEERAPVRLARDMAQARRTVDEALAAARAQPDKPLTLVDVGVKHTGTGVQRTARAAQSIPSEGADRITESLAHQDETQLTRMREDLAQLFGVQPEDAVQTAEDLVASRATNAAPAYEAAYAHGQVSEPVQRQFERLLSTREFRHVWQEARELAKDEGHILPRVRRLKTIGVKDQTAREAAARMEHQAAMNASAAETAFNPHSPAALAAREKVSAAAKTLSEAIGAKYEFVDPLDVRAIDYFKRAADDVIRGKMRSGPGAGGLSYQRGSVLLRKKNRFLDLVDREVPLYGAARAQFKSDSELMDAFQLGRDEILKMDPRAITKELAAMSPDEVQLVRRGALDAMTKQLENVIDTRDLTKTVLGKDLMRQRLRALAPSPEAADAWLAKFGTERKLREASNFVKGGSPTARIEADQAALGSAPFQAGAQLAGGHVGGAITTWLRSLLTQETGITSEMADALEPYLTATGKDLERRLEMIRAAGAREQVRSGDQTRVAHLLRAEGKGTVRNPLAALVGQTRSPHAPEANPFAASREQELSPADLWEQKRREGLSSEQATAYVRARAGAAPTDPVEAEVRRAGVDVSPLRRRPGESAAAYTRRVRAHDARVRADLATLFQSPAYTGLSDAVRAEDLSASSAAAERRRLIEQVIQRARSDSGRTVHVSSR